MMENVAWRVVFTLLAAREERKKKKEPWHLQLQLFLNYVHM